MKNKTYLFLSIFCLALFGCGGEGDSNSSLSSGESLSAMANRFGEPNGEETDRCPDEDEAYFYGKAAGGAVGHPVLKRQTKNDAVKDAEDAAQADVVNQIKEWGDKICMEYANMPITFECVLNNVVFKETKYDGNNDGEFDDDEPGLMITGDIRDRNGGQANWETACKRSDKRSTELCAKGKFRKNATYYVLIDDTSQTEVALDCGEKPKPLH